MEMLKKLNLEFSSTNKNILLNSQVKFRLQGKKIRRVNSVINMCCERHYGAVGCAKYSDEHFNTCEHFKMNYF